jgi:signal transduction histidine kinase
MPTDGSLSRRFLLAFILQALLISVTAILGVWFARIVLEEVLIEQALEDEAAWFWERHARDAVATDADPGAVPDRYRDFGPGVHALDAAGGLRSLHVSERGEARLYLVFDGQGVDLLTTYFGLVPLALVLVALYLTAFVGYRATHQVLSPITALAREIRRMDVRDPDPARLRQERFMADPDEEVAVLAGALGDFTERLNAYVERERTFTRDASHELRSPLTVIAMAVEVMQADPQLSARSRAAVERIERSVRDMRELVEAFLLLARDSEFAREPVSVNALVADELERARLTHGDEVAGGLEAHGELVVDAPRQVLASLIGNLIRNAFSYADGGRVSVRVGGDGLLIEDTGPGMDAEELERVFDPFFRGGGVAPDRGGHGVGLTIVRRLSDRFGWPVAIDSTPGVGTRVRVRFPDGRFETAAAPVPQPA